MGAQKQAKAVSSLAVSLKSAGDALLQMAHKSDELGELLGQQVAEEEARRGATGRRRRRMIPIPIPTPAPTRIDHVQRYGVWTQGTRGAVSIFVSNQHLKTFKVERPFSPDSR